MTASNDGEDASPAWSVAAVVEHIAGFMEENEVACTLRLLNKFVSKVLCDRTRVRMSMPSPHSAFALRWGTRGAVRPLTYKLRQKLLLLTATSGSVANLHLALAAVGCTPTTEVFAAASAAGHLPVCELLLRAGCPWDPEVLEAAARAGRLESVSWLLRAGCPQGPRLLATAAGAGRGELCEWLTSAAGAGLAWDAGAARAAARGGFTVLFEHAVAQLLGGGGGDDGAGAAAAAAVDPAALRWLLQGAAEGCDLGVLQWLHRILIDVPDHELPDPAAQAPRNAALQGSHHHHHHHHHHNHHHHNHHHRYHQPPQGSADLQPQQPHPPPQQQQPDGGLSVEARKAIICAALSSSTPDWRAKVSWLLARGYPPPSRSACSNAAAAAADAPERLAWLRGQGFPLDVSAVAVSAARAQRLDLADFVREQGQEHLNFLADQSSDTEPAFLLALHERGARVRRDMWLTAAVRYGNIEEAEWLLQPPDEPRPSGDAVAGGGSGAGVDGGEGGGESRGGGGAGEGFAGARAPAPAPLGVQVFATAAESGCLKMVAWLHGRGCEWDGRVFAAAAGAGCEEQLEWLAARGCPFSDGGEAYVRAARNGDLAMLQLLLRLGCPWGPAGSVFTAAVAWASELCVLRWLLDAGCPVDWDVALDAASLRQRPPGAVEWLLEERCARRRRRQCVVQ